MYYKEIILLLGKTIIELKHQHILTGITVTDRKNIK